MKKQLLTLGLSMLSVAASAQVLETKSANDFLHYSFPVTQSAKLETTQAYNALSSSYLMEVSGAQLNKGVTLNTTQSNVSFLISRKSGASQLDTGLLQLRHANAPSVSLVDTRVTAEQLSQVGMFRDTVALNTVKDAAFGALTLKSEQGLAASDKYIVQVKEKNSPYNLSVSIPTQSYTAGDKVIARGEMLKGSDALNIDKATAQLVAPNGKVSQVSVKVNGDEVVFSAAEQADIISPINGLYELRVQSVASDNDLSIPRYAKVAFALSRDTAKLNGASFVEKDGLSANVRLVAKEAGRYEVRGILYGTNARGQLVPVMETHAAQSTNAGSDSIKLPFDAAILADANVKAPYELRDVRLYDQKQLGLVDTLARNVSFGGKNTF
ncbi:DUF4785 domain-containing protein [Alteromonas sp. a30]|uniref:DUF4785 domain-containing protein n=1 Tax=Alteromonas sp. a30 TaxID=2730917 RepID=UPI00227E9A63|nr:DUF4785 domain-containing protein [Alteromonas sp. a30]MCY7297553.1 DUF4785 family protein [Alteromonas sp. a30]